jgi:hypothetical protein
MRNLLAIKRLVKLWFSSDHFLSSVDADNNYRNNLVPYYNVISAERWEVKSLDFIPGVCEANLYSCYKVFATGGDKIDMILLRIS